MESWFLASGGKNKGPGDRIRTTQAGRDLNTPQLQAPRSAHQEDAPSRADLARQVCFLDRAFEIRGFGVGPVAFDWSQKLMYFS
jgi:hypothetical protein